MSREIDRKIATDILGYEVQESPRGTLYIHHESKTWPLPDYERDIAAVESACDAWCIGDRGARWFTVVRSSDGPPYGKYTAELIYDGISSHYHHGPTMAAALYAALTRAINA